MQQAYPGQQPSGAFNANSGPEAAGASPASTAATGTAVAANKNSSQLTNGGRFDFDDGGTYCGGWEDGKAHGHGVCTGPKGQGAYSGSWHFGFEVSGVYTWPSGSAYEGQWQNGKRHGLGVESRGRWIYRGEWTQGYKGRYGVRQSTTSTAKYEGTWANGLQDGYGSEMYADGGTYQGQWLRGMRHGYGVRASAPFGLASHYRPKQSLRASLSSLRSNEAFSNSGGGSAAGNAVAAAAERDRRVDDARGGFVLKAKSDEPPHRRRSLVEKSLKKSILSGLKMRKQRSTGDLDQRVTSAGSLRSNASSASWVSMDSSQEPANGGSFHTDSNASFVVEDEHMDANVTETYMGEWKNDKRSGFGISERSDGLRYEGEWFNNKKYGYGVTILRDGTREEGKYKNNVLITSQKKKHIFLIRSAKFRERIDAAVNAAQRASKISLQKADIAISRMATARGKAEQADISAHQAREDFEIARLTAKQFAPDFTQPSLEKLRLRDLSKYRLSLDEKYPPHSTAQSAATSSTNEPNNSHHSHADQIPNTNNPPLPPRTNRVAPPAENYPHRPSVGGQFQSQSPHQSKELPDFSLNSHLSNFQNHPSSQHYQQQYNAKPNHYPNQQEMEQDLRPHSRPHPMTADHSASATAGHAPPMAPRTQSNTYYQSAGIDRPMNENTAYNGNNQYVSASNYATDSQRQHAPTRSAVDHAATAATASAHFPPHRAPPPPPQSSLSANFNCSPSRSYTQHQFRHNSSQFTRPEESPASRHPYDNLRQNSFDLSSRTTHAAAEKSMYPHKMNSIDVPSSLYNRNAALRRNSKPVSGDSPYYFTQVMSDHFGHYERPPSRDGSEDRYSRAASRLSGSSRQPSVDRTAKPSEANVLLSATDRPGSRGGSVVRGTTPTVTGNGSVIGEGIGPILSNRSPTSSQIQQSQLPFEDIIIRKRSLGQDILPSPIGQPKRTESLYVTGGIRKESQHKDPQTSLQRKKSLPDFQNLSTATNTTPMSREEVSVLSSARREEMRKMQEENERLRANPLLYLVSPRVKEWFSRQQLLLVILFINISLAIIFFKLLTS